jgi:hypothetical protein
MRLQSLMGKGEERLELASTNDFVGSSEKFEKSIGTVDKQRSSTD